MSSLQVGSQRSAQHRPTPLIFGALLALALVVAVAYFVAAMSGTQYNPSNTTSVPATYAPGVPATNIPSAVPTVAPRYP